MRKSSSLSLSVDLMGSDQSYLELFEAVLKAAELFPACIFYVLATQEALLELRPRFTKKNIHLTLVKEVINMDEEPLKALKSKKNSSLLVGLRLLKKNKVKAFITAGNTGALMAGAAVTLEKLPGIRRPALLASLPTSQGLISVLDAGGTVQCKASLLYEYAKLGTDYHKAIYEIENPRVGLLNVGLEAAKGTSEHQKAYKLLSHLPNFIGNVEGRAVFEGATDVLVTDGFTGNILLKAAEGVSSLIFNALSQKLSPKNKNVLIPIQDEFNWTRYPGAILIGVKGLVIKCHGSSNREALFTALKNTIQLLQRQA